MLKLYEGIFYQVHSQHTFLVLDQVRNVRLLADGDDALRLENGTDRVLPVAAALTETFKSQDPILPRLNSPGKLEDNQLFELLLESPNLSWPLMFHCQFINYFRFARF